MNDADQRLSLERRIVSLEEKNGRLTSALTAARTELIRLQGELADVSRPPQTLAAFVRAFPAARQIEVVTGGKRMRVAVSPKLDVTDLSYGQWVRLDDTMIAVAADDFARSGQVVSILDARSGIALERIVREDVEQLLAPEVPDVTYGDIGGLDAQIAQVRDSIEMPFNHPELYRQFGLRPPKGILLYGPPGSGKTLIAKAVANSLSRRGGASTFFLSIKGPELLNKFVGETERQIRAIFARARTLAAADTPVVIFFDEMEALFRTRGTGVSSDVETMIVPQLLAEMDGVESLDNVVIIGASNRADMIDPAVLRPGRLDVRIRVDRPDRAGALDIFSKYLTPRVPIHASEVARFGGLDEAVAGMIERAVDALYTRDETTALFLATLVSGEHKRIYLADLVSGALIAGIVERAKKYAIKDALSGEAAGLTMGHLLRGVHEEMNESLELAATSSPEDWARTSGLAPEIVSVKPIGGVK